MRAWHSFCVMGFLLCFQHFSLLAATLSVELMYPKSTQMTQALELSGTINSKNNAQIASLVHGVVTEILVEAGDHVEQGQTLIILDSTIAKAKLQQTQANMLAANAVYEEAARLYQEVLSLSQKQVVAKTLIAERKSDLAITKAQQAKANAEFAEQQEVVKRHQLVAPFAGVIAERHVDLGEWVNSQKSVITLVDDQSLRLELEVPQEYYRDFKEQNNISVLIRPDIKNIEEFSALATRVIAVSDEHSRTFSVFVDLNHHIDLIPGSSAHASIAFQINNQHQVWLPKSALKHHPDGGYSVFSVSDNIVKRHIVSVVETTADRVAIKNVPPDLAFVTSGVELLQDGQVVRVSAVSGMTQ